MKYLGIDFGEKRVGIAISDDEGGIAFPRSDLDNDQKLIPSLVQTIELENVEVVVVGDTRSHGGAANAVTHSAEKFVAALSSAVGVPIKLVPEMWSSIEASRYAPKGQEHNNAAAASIILQRFLDMRGQDREE